jgi:hypothetical protein
MAAKLARIQRELGSLAELAERHQTRVPEHDIGEIHEREHEIETVRQGER